MPTSSPVVITEVIAMVSQVPAAERRRVLDVGPGYGKYGLMLREYLNEKPRQLDAIEAWPQYVIDFPWLGCIYDQVHVGDVCDRGSEFLARYDVVLMADVLEHIPTSDALAMFARVPGRIVICTPADFFHNGDNLPPTEAHVSHWTVEQLGAIAVDQGREMEVGYVNAVGAVLVRLGPIR